MTCRPKRFSTRQTSVGAAAIASGLLCSCAGFDGQQLTANAPPELAPGIVRASAPTALPSAYDAAAPSQIVQMSGKFAVAAGERPDNVSFSPADARLPVGTLDCPANGYAANACPTGCPPYGAAGGGAFGVASGIEPRTDEYLCDGGDRSPPVHYDRTFRHGLDSEDTVGEWSDPAGKHHVTPSNKVCVYAPRFGEVRSFTAPVGGTKVERLVSANDVSHGAGLDARTYLDSKVQKTAIDATRVRTRASGLEIDNAVSGFDQATSASLHLKDVPPIVNTAFLRRGQLERGQEAFLAKGIQSAVVWTRTEFPIIAATDVSAQEVRAEFRPSEIVGLEDMGRPGQLRVIKIADKGTAAVGEIITFTIRYDNLGDKPVHHVRVIDNLTPRLELVEGSGTSDRKGRLDVEPNGEGSFVLTFVIDEDLPGKTGGTVTFQARVK
ncbi:MAG: DUF11 domain-containing protein [Planctomycetota bacterium]|nr:isopeptide-forming domain-containing fimbrial protein [Planctomycetaceae bacterium]MDQ3330190.1 DUF11 domain-containing protein [Planctomycetota bacterium]